MAKRYDEGSAIAPITELVKADERVSVSYRNKAETMVACPRDVVAIQTVGHTVDEPG